KRPATRDAGATAPPGVHQAPLCPTAPPLPLCKHLGRDSAREPGRGGSWGGQGMEIFIQQLINGITLGSIYGLIALGYTMVFGIIGMVNFAHGDVFMVSAFIALITFLLLTTWLGI